MKNIKWLLTLADGKPLIFSLAILLIAVSTLSLVVVDRDRKVDACEDDKTIIHSFYMRKIDSIVTSNTNEKSLLNAEVKSTLAIIIEGYKEQLEEQKNLNNKISTTISKTKNLISKNRTQIKNRR